MKQICDGYNPKVLMGNWYEQSYAVSQPARDNPCKVARTKQVDIGFIDNKGRLRELNTVSRLQPWNTSNLVTTSQFTYDKEKPITVNKQNYDLKTTQNFHGTFKAQPFCKQNKVNYHNKSHVQIDKFQRNHRLFNEKNINQLLISRESDETSFKTLLKPNHHPNYNQYLQSIYKQQISSPKNFTMTNKSEEQQQQTKKEKKCQQQVKNFRRIRSEITLKTTTNFPFTFK